MQSFCFTAIMNNFIFITVITKLIWHISLILCTEPSTLSRSCFLYFTQKWGTWYLFCQVGSLLYSDRRNVDERSNAEASSRLFFTRTLASTMNYHENKQKRENPEKVGFKSVKLVKWIHFNFVVALNWKLKFFVVVVV